MPRGIPMANWNGLVLSQILTQLEDFKQQGFPPTLRGMYYTLVDLGVIPKTQGAYGALSDHTSRWRENGKLPMDCFADDTRRIVDIDDEYETIQDFIEAGIDYLEKVSDNYTIPRWHCQPNYVEIWIEKDAGVKPFKSIVKGKEVRVIPNRGHSSVAFLNENIDRLKVKQAEGKKINIGYCGDEDPSGEAMDTIYRRKFIEYGLYNVNFVRLTVTSKQTKKFNLLHDPDPETLQKLIKDPNKEPFKKRYGLKSDSELFAVQLEAMQTPKVRGYLKEIVLKFIDDLFDDKIYDDTQAKGPKPLLVNKLVQIQIMDLYLRLLEEKKRLKTLKLEQNDKDKPDVKGESSEKSEPYERKDGKEDQP